jgi:O-antigen/teichoic acid export membrane protein
MINFKSFVEINFNVKSILYYRIWNIIAGIIVVFVIPNYLNYNIQGYYFTFLSIVALQIIFELGLSQIITQISSHEFAHVEPYRTTHIKNNDNINKLIYIKHFIKSWYKKISLLFFITTWTLGALYFSLFSTDGSVDWAYPWLIMVLATAINLFLTPRFGIIEGAGETGRVAMVRLTQSILGHALMVIVILAGGQLWSVIVVPLTASIYSFAWLAFSKNPYRNIPMQVGPGIREPQWRSELMGLQWRVALAWLGGYLSYQTIVPIVFAFQGSGEAGRIGMALQISGTLQTLGMSWIAARSPEFGYLISRGEFRNLRRLFVRSSSYAVATTLVCSTLVAIGIQLIVALYPNLEYKLPSITVSLILIATSTFGAFTYAMAAYMRAHKTEPLVISSLVTGATTVVLATIGGQSSAVVVIALYAFVTLCISTPWTYVLYRRYRDFNITREVA